jgi:hypothetical protein
MLVSVVSLYRRVWLASLYRDHLTTLSDPPRGKSPSMILFFLPGNFPVDNFLNFIAPTDLNSQTDDPTLLIVTMKNT